MKKSIYIIRYVIIHMNGHKYATLGSRRVSAMSKIGALIKFKKENHYNSKLNLKRFIYEVVRVKD